MPGTRLAVDFSGTTLRVLEGMPGGPMQAVEAPMPPGSIEGGRVVDGAAIGTVLGEMLASLRITETRAMLALSDTIASFRVMTFPKATSDPEVEASIKS